VCHWKMIRCYLSHLAGYASVILLLLTFGNLGVIVAQERSGPGATLTYYDTPKVQIEGVLVRRKIYGPPGYGETPTKDIRATILVLKLSHPISVEPTPTAKATDTPDLDAVKNIREVQLFISPSKGIAPQKFIGRVVAIGGALHESITASQYTKVWLDVEKLTAQ